MHLDNLFRRPAFVPQFSDYSRFHNVGLTGGRGVLGSILRKRLADKDVTFTCYEADLNDAAEVERWFRGRSFSHFFHFAAIVPVTRVEADPLRAFETNAIGTFTVVKSWIRTQTKESWFFHCSTSHVYAPARDQQNLSEDSLTDPPTFYGVTKLAAEQIAGALLNKYGFPFCIGRVFSFSHVTQPEPYLVPTLINRIGAAHDGETLDVSNPSAVRDIQDAETVIDCLLHMAGKRVQGLTNIGSGEGKTVREIAEAAVQLSGKKLTVTGTDREKPSRVVADITRLQSFLTP